MSTERQMDNTHLSLIDEIRFSLTNDRWNEFVSKYGQLLSKWLAGQGVQRADADEIKQKVMLVVVEELPSFEHNGNLGAFRNWLRQIMANRLRQHWKQVNARRLELNYDELADSLMAQRSEQSTAWDREHNEFLLKSLLHKARQRFGDEKVDMFQKVTLQNLAADQVASEYQISVGALRVSQHRIIRELRSYGEGILF